MTTSYKTIIIDDEPLARLNIREALKDTTNWEVVAEFESGDISLKIFDKLAADVLFLDIQMPAESGISLAKRMMSLSSPPIIVFVTAYDDYAIQAFELHAMDYMLKPFDNTRFSLSVNRIKQALKSSESRLKNLKQLHHFIETPAYLNKILIKSIGAIRIIDIENIIWLASSGNYVEVHHTEGCHLHRVSLSFLEKHLNPKIFYRVHRKAIVRLTEVREIKTLPDNKYKLALSNGEQVDVSKTFKDKLIEKVSC